MLYFILFIFGSAIGSFLNVLIYRMEKGESFVSGRSYCPHCKKQIRFYDNIPILSFLVLRAKCRDCQQKISWQYPLVEAAIGILFVVVYSLSLSKSFNFENPSTTLRFAQEIIVFSGLFAILVYDFKHYIIPNKIIYPLIALVLSFEILDFTFNFNLPAGRHGLLTLNFFSWQYFLLSLIIPLFFLSLIIISRGKWMGMGDVKLALFMALFLGWPNVLVAAVLSFWLGTLASLPLLILGGKNMKSQIPFGPFLIIGTFIAYFWGSRMISWYLSVSL